MTKPDSQPRLEPAPDPTDPAPPGEPRDVVDEAVELIRDIEASEGDEEAWAQAANRRVLRHFREALYGPDADLVETTGVYPSKSERG